MLSGSTSETTKAKLCIRDAHESVFASLRSLVALMNVFLSSVCHAARRTTSKEFQSMHCVTVIYDPSILRVFSLGLLRYEGVN